MKTKSKTPTVNADGASKYGTPKELYHCPVDKQVTYAPVRGIAQKRIAWAKAKGECGCHYIA